MGCCCPADIARAACVTTSRARSLQRHVVSFFEAERPVAAICHGVLLAARSISKRTGRSVLYGYRTTALTWALERSAWRVARVTRFWDPNYYRTYLEQDGQPDGFMSVQQEVTRALALPDDFMRRSQDRSGLPPEDVRPAARYPSPTRGPPSWCGSQLCFGEMAGRRAYLRKDICRHAAKLDVGARFTSRHQHSIGSTLP